MKKQINVQGGVGLVAMYHASLLELQAILDEQLVGDFYEARPLEHVQESEELARLAHDRNAVLER